MALIYTEISQKSAKSSFLCEYSRILCASKEEGGYVLGARLWTTANDETSCTVSNFHT